MTTHQTGDLHEVGVRTAEVLAEALGWQLNTERWQRIAAQLESVEDALKRRDPEDLAADVADLRRWGPVRIDRIGSSIRPGPAPRDVRERLIHLVHELEDLLVTNRPLPTDERPAPETRG
jgi:hypothetical protein